MNMELYFLQVSIVKWIDKYSNGKVKKIVGTEQDFVLIDKNNLSKWQEAKNILIDSYETWEFKDVENKDNFIIGKLNKIIANHEIVDGENKKIKLEKMEYNGLPYYRKVIM